MDETQRLILRQRALDALKERIGRESYLSVKDVMDRLKLGRTTVESLPIEVLPYSDYGTATRALRRYHPADVIAADARIRAWKAAKARGEGEAHLAKLREELEARDRAAIEVAAEVAREVA